MIFYREIDLPDGRRCILRNGTSADAEEVMSNFIKTHEETDYLTSYPDEISFTVEYEREYLKRKTESDREIEMVAEVEGRIVGTAGVDGYRAYRKLRHRCSFGISIEKDFWGLGIGRALTESCIECARKAGYTQMELEVVSYNKRAVSLYKSVGFQEMGRNPLGFNSDMNGMQEIIMMRLLIS